MSVSGPPTAFQYLGDFCRRGVPTASDQFELISTVCRNGSCTSMECSAHELRR